MPGSASTPTPSTPNSATTRSSRRPKPNPQYPTQPGFQATTDVRERLASASSSPASPSTNPKKHQTPKTPKTNATDGKSMGADDLERKLRKLENRVLSIEEERRRKEGEIQTLRDKLEEAEWAQHQLEEEVKRLKEEVKSEKEAKERWREEVKEVIREEKEKLVVDVEERRRSAEKGGNREIVPEAPAVKRRHRCIILTDSNGRDVTADSVRNHMPRQERDDYDINIVVAYRIDEAIALVQQGTLDVNGCYVVIDNMTNHVKSSWRAQADSPEQLVHRLDRLRCLLLSSSAAAVIVCQIKPMRMFDVRPYNHLVSRYLDNCGHTGYGCLTQIRMEYLKPDGTHINPQYDGVLDRTYACALRGTHVPQPTPEDNFIPDSFRRRWENEWPGLVRRPGQGHPFYHHAR